MSDLTFLDNVALRDHFAGLAMQSYLQDGEFSPVWENEAGITRCQSSKPELDGEWKMVLTGDQALAKRAYAIASVMVGERENQS